MGNIHTIQPPCLEYSTGESQMKHPLAIVISALLIATLACGSTTGTSTPGAQPTPEHSVFDAGRTVYGFFPSPPDITFESVLATIKAIGEHGDVLLVQRNIPWNDFLKGTEG